MKKVLALVMCLVLALVFVGCAAKDADAPAADTPAADTPAADTPAADTPEADAPAADAEVGSVEFLPLVDDGTGEIQPLTGIGPNGEEPLGIEAVQNLITAEDEKAIKEAGYTAAICFQTLNLDWSQLELKGITAVLEKYNIELIAVTDGEQDPAKQLADYESVIEMNPDLLITIPVDRDASADVLKKAADKGIEIVFIDSVSSGMEYPTDYAGMGTADNYANGWLGAEALAEKIGGEGEVAILYFKYDMWHCNQRTDAARDCFNSYEGISIVDEQGVGSAEEAATATESLLIAHPNLKAIWTVWDAAGTAAAGAIMNLGRECYVATVDLGYDAAYMIADPENPLICVGAQHPYDQGVAQATMGVAALCGKETPSYVVVPGEKVTRESMVRSWNRVFREEMNDTMKDLLK